MAREIATNNIKLVRYTDTNLQLILYIHVGNREELSVIRSGVKFEIARGASTATAAAAPSSSAS